MYFCSQPGRPHTRSLHNTSTGLRSVPNKRCKTFIKLKRKCVEHCSGNARVATMAAEKIILCVLFEEFSEPDEIDINTCLVLQNTLDVTVTALAVQNKREHPNRMKGFVETVLPNYCDPTLASHFRMKIHFRWRKIHFLPPRLCYDLYDLIIYLLIGLTFLRHPPNKRKRISNPVAHRCPP